MQIIVISSPGPGGQSHWSHALAHAFAKLAVTRGASVSWLAALHVDETVPVGGTGLQVIAHQQRRVLPVAKVAASQLDAPLELALTELLRAQPRAVVVHVGLGGQGSPNVLWLADRLGSSTFACLRGVELVCHRGDLMDRNHQPCQDWLHADRCRWCCSKSWWDRPRSNDLRNRLDLFVAGLQVCTSISVACESDVSLVVSLGIAEERVAIGDSAEELLARVWLTSP